MISFDRLADRVLDRRAATAPERELPPEERWRHLTRYGDFALAYSAVSEPYLRSFGDERGFIMYAQKMGETFVLGDPIAGARDHRSLIDEFIATFGKPVFVAVNGDTAALLSERGYRINHVGHDTAIDLPSHSFAGGQGKRIRYATSWLRTNGLRIEERGLEALDPDLLKRLSKRWRESRVGGREVRFLNRMFKAAVAALPDVRSLVALDAAGELVGFISFDPVYREGRVIGYLASQKRRDPEGSTYLDLALMREAIDRFKGEGREVIYLGLSPLAGIQPAPFPENRALRALFAAAYRSAWINRRFFNVQGIAGYKSRFRGREIPFYMATPPGLNLLRLTALLRLLRLI